MMLTSVEDPVHFIGIGGSGMAGLAELALHRKMRVQGSDLVHSLSVARLQQLGAKISTTHHADSLGHARTVVYSSAIEASNSELVEAKRRSLRTMHRSDFLDFLMEGKCPITVAGTHGKSTTSAMITHVLDDLGCKPWAVIGGQMMRYGSSALVGEGDFFVAEADESDGSLLKYRPYVSVLTNVECDHMDYFKTELRVLEVFSEYLSRTHQDGTAVIGWDHLRSRDLGIKHQGNRLTYGFTIGSEVRALSYSSELGVTRFSAMVEHDLVQCNLPMIGKHNVQNALCALAVTRALELDVRQAAASLESFRGVHRRMSLIFASPTVTIFDDYAHNPGKIAACINCLRETWPDRPLHVVYQPHRFSRLETMYDEMLDALHSADFIYVVPVYSAGESTTKDFSPGKLANDILGRFEAQVFACPQLADASAQVLSTLGDSAVILTVGAGDVWRVAQDLKEALA